MFLALTKLLQIINNPFKLLEHTLTLQTAPFDL